MSPLDRVNSQSVGDNPLNLIIETLGNLSGNSGSDIGSAPNLLDQLGNPDPSDRLSSGNNISLNNTEIIIANAFCNGGLPADDARILLLKDKFSIIEQDFCRRVGSYIPLFGYDIFERKSLSSVVTNGEINDDYIIGVGDTLVLTFVGSLSNTFSVVVNSQGSIVLDKLPPMPTAGKSFGEVKKLIQEQVDLYFGGTDAYVSIGNIREISIVVTGEVKIPGQHRVTALSSILDALSVAGGVKKTGSLRNIKLRRKNSNIEIDLYGLIAGSASFNKLVMREGDQIIVPTLGPVIGIAGDVKRPVLVELVSEDSSIEMERLLDFGGGEIRPRGNIYTLSTFDENGNQSVKSLNTFDSDYNFLDGDMLVVSRGREILKGGVWLTGHVSLPGRRVLETNPTIGSLIGSDLSSLKKNPYLLFGVLETVDNKTKTRRYYGIDLEKIVDGIEDFELRDGDNLIILGKKDIKFLSSKLIQSILLNDISSISAIDNSVLKSSNSPVVSGGQNSSINVLTDLANKVSNLTGSLALQNNSQNVNRSNDQNQNTASIEQNNCTSASELRKLVNDFGSKRFSNAIISTALNNKNDKLPKITCPKIYEDNSGLLAFVLEYSALVLGEVRAPGIYPINEVSMSSLVSVSGGLTRDADLKRTEMSNFSAKGPQNSARQLLNLENISLSDIYVRPADVIRFNSKPSSRDSGPVQISGAVRQPGTYQIRSGERVSELLQRAGGLTDLAYPYGSVFLRESIARAEKEALVRLTRELNTALVAAATNRRVSSDSITALAQLASTLNTAPATGRMVIEADPTVLMSKPELDVILEPGDILFVPKRPSSVLVTGDVLNPGAMQFIAGKTVNEYVVSAGGFQRSADKNKVFVVLPNGSAQPAGSFFFQYAETQVPPGSTVVVPKDATPFDAFNLTREVSQVFSQLAVGTAALKSILGN